MKNGLKGFVLASFFVALLTTTAALAEEYRVPILVDSEEDILELYYSGDISEDERDLLQRLFTDPLDLSRATRDDLYNLPGLTWDMVDGVLKYRKAKLAFKNYIKGHPSTPYARAARRYLKKLD